MKCTVEVTHPVTNLFTCCLTSKIVNWKLMSIATNPPKYKLQIFGYC